MTPHHPEDCAKTESAENRRRELRQLAETYALQVRKLSEAVANLGRNMATELPFQDTVREIKKIHMHCMRAGEELFAAVEPMKARSTSVAGAAPPAPSGSGTGTETGTPTGRPAE